MNNLRRLLACFGVIGLLANGSLIRSACATPLTNSSEPCHMACCPADVKSVCCPAFRSAGPTDQISIAQNVFSPQILVSAVLRPSTVDYDPHRVEVLNLPRGSTQSLLFLTPQTGPAPPIHLI